MVPCHRRRIRIGQYATYIGVATRNVNEPDMRVASPAVSSFNSPPVLYLIIPIAVF
jgi:hypothetical protein